MTIELGQIGLINTPGPWYSLSGLIRFFTKQKGVPAFSHGLTGIGEVLGCKSVREAEYCITCKPWEDYENNLKVDYEIYEVVGVPIERVQASIIDRYKKHPEDIYGYFQIFWWVWRWLVGLVGITLSGFHNPMPAGTICTEDIWFILDGIGDPEISTALSKFKGSDNFAPTDLWLYMHYKLPHRFKKVAGRRDGVVWVLRT